MDTSPASSSARLFFFLLLSFVLAGSVLEAIWRRRPPSSLDSKARAEASCLLQNRNQVSWKGHSFLLPMWTETYGGASVRQEAIQALASECDVALERKMVARRGALTSALILEYLSRSGRELAAPDDLHLLDVFASFFLSFLLFGTASKRVLRLKDSLDAFRL